MTQFLTVTHHPLTSQPIPEFQRLHENCFTFPGNPPITGPFLLNSQCLRDSVSHWLFTESPWRVSPGRDGVTVSEFWDMTESQKMSRHYRCQVWANFLQQRRTDSKSEQPPSPPHSTARIAWTINLGEDNGAGRWEWHPECTAQQTLLKKPMVLFLQLSSKHSHGSGEEEEPKEPSSCRSFQKAGV